MPFQISLVARQERPQPRGGLAVGAAAAGQLLRTPAAAAARMPWHYIYCSVTSQIMENITDDGDMRMVTINFDAQVKAVAVDVGAVAVAQLHHLRSARVAAPHPPLLLLLSSSSSSFF